MKNRPPLTPKQKTRINEMNTQLRAFVLIIWNNFRPRNTKIMNNDLRIAWEAAIALGED